VTVTDPASDAMEALIEALAAEVERRVLDRLAASDDDTGRWLRGARAIADHLGCGVDRVWALSSAGRLPLHRDGSALLAHTDELDRWLRNGGAKRP
jgi:hypothetical protein